MEREYKELLLKDICARLPYGLKASFYGEIEECETWDTIEGIEIHGSDPKVYIGVYYLNIEEVKPYLFPLESMTEEQKEELFDLCQFYTQEDWEGKKSEAYAIEISSRFDPAYCYDHTFYMWGRMDMRAINYLLKNHFDINGLIEKGLAIDATGKNIY